MEWQIDFTKVGMHSRVSMVAEHSHPRTVSPIRASAFHKNVPSLYTLMHSIFMEEFIRQILVEGGGQFPLPL